MTDTDKATAEARRLLRFMQTLTFMLEGPNCVTGSLDVLVLNPLIESANHLAALCREMPPTTLVQASRDASLTSFLDEHDVPSTLTVPDHWKD